MEFIFGIEGKWVNAKEQHCERCALNEFCDKIIATEAEVPYICADDNPFSHRYFLSQESFRESIRKHVEYMVKKFNLRRGQATFNAIDSQYEKLAAFIKESFDVDCFYHDELIDKVIELCYLYIDSPGYINWANEQRGK